jgi:hypothetical protein
VLLFLLGVGGLAVTTIVIAVRGGRGPADPPASHERVDPAGFVPLSEPRGVLPRRPRTGQAGVRRASRLSAATAAAAVHTARESRTARRMSPRTGG